MKALAAGLVRIQLDNLRQAHCPWRLAMARFSATS